MIISTKTGQKHFQPVAVIDVVRTGIRRSFKSKFASRRPDDMVAECTDHIAEKFPSLINEGADDFIVGCALPEGAQGFNLGRNCVAVSSLSSDVPGQTVNRYCGSGLQAVVNGATSIASGNAKLIFSAGVESVAMVMPYVNTMSMRNPRIVEQLPTLYTYLFDEEETRPFVKRAGLNMVGYAEVAAKMFSICRCEQDDHSYLMQERAQNARERGLFSEEIIPGGPDELRVDEFLLRGTKRADYDRFSPVIAGENTVTARNSAPLAEGASVAMLAAPELAVSHGIRPLGYFLAYAVCATNPEFMGLGASQAIRKLLAKTGVALEDIDLFEINEPFAAIGLATLQQLGLDRERVNRNGSALALGHPYGMSGTRIVGALLRELNRTGGRFGIAAACVGGGMGIAALFIRNMDEAPLERSLA